MKQGIKHEGQMSRRTTRSINMKIWSTKKEKSQGIPLEARRKGVIEESKSKQTNKSRRNSTKKNCTASFNSSNKLS